jgi:hypothetical protein
MDLDTTLLQTHKRKPLNIKQSHTPPCRAPKGSAPPHTHARLIYIPPSPIALRQNATEAILTSAFAPPPLCGCGHKHGMHARRIQSFETLKPRHFPYLAPALLTHRRMAKRESVTTRWSNWQKRSGQPSSGKLTSYNDNVRDGGGDRGAVIDSVNGSESIPNTPPPPYVRTYRHVHQGLVRGGGHLAAGRGPAADGVEGGQGVVVAEVADVDLLGVGWVWCVGRAWVVDGFMYRDGDNQPTNQPTRQAHTSSYPPPPKKSNHNNNPPAPRASASQSWPPPSPASTRGAGPAPCHRRPPPPARASPCPRSATGGWPGCRPRRRRARASGSPPPC